MATLKQPINPGTGSTDTLFVYARVLSLDTVNQLAHVIDQLGQQRVVTLTRVFGRPGTPPAVGETWIITRMFGDWAFAMLLQAAAVPTPADTWHGLNYTGANVGDYGAPSSIYNYGQYTKLSGIVYLTGLLTTTGTVADNGLMFTMPPGYRIAAPMGSLARIYFAASETSTSNTPFRFYMNSSGEVRHGSITGASIASGQAFAITGLSYPADS